MNATQSPAQPTVKKAKWTSCAIGFLQLLRMFWVTELALLLVVSYGLYAGWAVPMQWSNAFFYAAVAQILIAATSVAGSSGEISAASYVRYIAKGDVAETRRQLAQVALHKDSFALRVFLGSMLTILIAVLVMHV